MNERWQGRITKDRPYLFLSEEIADLLGYADRKQVRRAMKDGTFPVPFFKIHGRICLDRAVLSRFFKEIRRDQLEQYEKMYG